MCPKGQLEDGRGGCVKRQQCPCEYNNVFHPPGKKITQQCNTWWTSQPFFIFFCSSTSSVMTQRNLIMIQCRWSTANAMRGSGGAQSAHATPPAQCTEKVITPLLMIRSSSFSGTVITFWHRYSTYHLLIDFFCFLLYCYRRETDSFFFSEGLL